VVISQHGNHLILEKISVDKKSQQKFFAQGKKEKEGTG